MSGKYVIYHEQCGADQQHPCECEVPLPRICQAVGRGDRHQRRKGIGRTLRIAEKARRRDLETADREETAGPAVADDQPGMIGVRAILAPVQPRMRIEDHHPAHQHHEDAPGVDPVPDPHRQFRAVDQRRSGVAGALRFTVRIVCCHCSRSRQAAGMLPSTGRASAAKAGSQRNRQTLHHAQKNRVSFRTTRYPRSPLRQTGHLWSWPAR